MIRHLAAVAATTTLLVSALPAAQAAATDAASCAKRVLKVPADSLPGSSAARTADPTGRYILGEANRDGRMHPNAVLWVNGVPRWLGSQPQGETFAYSVIEGGLVLGSTSSNAGTDNWIYSAKTGAYRILQPPAGLRINVRGMNAHQDIIGTAWDEALQRHVPFVWPAGGQLQVLPLPSGVTVGIMDEISDEGLIVGRLDVPDVGRTSYLWKSWSAEPARLPGVNESNVWARDIEGPWIGGEESGVDNDTGLLWNAADSAIVQIEKGVIDLNSSRDVVTAGLFGPLGDYPSTIIKQDGTKITFPDGTMLQHIFERGTRWTAAGFDISSGTSVPTVYACR